MQDQISGGRIRGRNSVQAPEGSCISFPNVLHSTPPKKHCHTPSATTSKPPPQEPEETVPEVSAPVVREVELASEAPSSAVSQALEVDISTHMTPLHLQLGGHQGFISGRWRGAVRGHQPHMPLSAHMCAKII